MNRIEKLHSFLKQNPDDEFTLYALALEYKKENNSEFAIEYFEKCIKLNSSFLAAYYQLCEILAQINKLEHFSTRMIEAKKIALNLNDLKTYNELITLENEII
jgi:tetratricopeptide (TPR) repeat protein